METAEVVYTHDSDEADDVAEDLREVAFRLESGTEWKLQWSTAGFPTTVEIASLAEDPLFARLEPALRRRNRGCLLDDQSTHWQTTVARGDGILLAIQG